MPGIESMSPTMIMVGVTLVATLAMVFLEHQLHFPKHESAIGGAFIAFLIVLQDPASRERMEHELVHAESSIHQIIWFLLPAMLLISYARNNEAFAYITMKLLGLRWSDKRQFWVIQHATFFLSAVIDNLTTAILFGNISGQFFKGKNQTLAYTGVISASNAGGAWSPIGDITTYMLWIAKKFTAWQVIKWVFLPAYVQMVMTGYLLRRQMDDDTQDEPVEPVSLSFGNWLVIVLVLLSFFLPLVMTALGSPIAYIGLWGGVFIVGATQALISYIRRRNGRGNGHETKLDDKIRLDMEHIEVPSIFFFAGILLLVELANMTGLLEWLSLLLFGMNPTQLTLYAGSIGLAFLSAVIDNIPLTAIAIRLLTTTDPRVWVFLAYCVGTGGSLLLYGSAAGVVISGISKGQLTFFDHLRKGFVPTLVGFLAGVVVFFMQPWLYW